MTSWITKSGVIYEGNEKTTLPNDLYIRFYADGEFNFSIISTNMPSSVVIGPYLNFKFDKQKVSTQVLNEILSLKGAYGNQDKGKGKN